MIDLEQVDELLAQLSEMLDPNATTDMPGESVAGPANTVIGGGPVTGAGVSPEQMTYHQNQFSGQRNPPGALGLSSAGTVAGSALPLPTDAGISQAQMTQHQNQFTMSRVPPSVALGLGVAGTAAGGDLDSAM